MKPLKDADTEPLWREEFSIESSHEKIVSRRQFTKFLTLTSLGMFVGNLWILGKTWLEKQPLFPKQVVTKAIDVPVGGVKLFRYPTEADAHFRDDVFQMFL